MENRAKFLTDQPHRSKANAENTGEKAIRLPAVNVPSIARGSGVVQRVVNNLNLGGAGKDTIRQVLLDPAIKGIYALPDKFETDLRKGSLQLDRAQTAEAEIDYSPNPGRGKSTGDFDDVGTLGKWERLATTHDTAKKTQDVGHLIADEFFDSGQKKLAYAAGNLAPQNAEQNEQAYRQFLESKAGDDLKRGATVGIKVDLTYSPDTITVPVSVLVERGALKVLDQVKHDLLVKSGHKIDIPRRFPTTWNFERKFVSGVLPPLIPAKKGAKNPPPPLPQVVPVGLVPSPQLSNTHFSPFDPSRTTYTPAVPFSVSNISTSSTLEQHSFQQQQPFYDPEAKRNPARIGAHPESGNYTRDQQKRSRALILRANKSKFITALDKGSKTIFKRRRKEQKKSSASRSFFGVLTGSLRNLVFGAPPDLKLMNDRFYARMVRLIQQAVEGEKKKDLVKKIKLEFDKEGYTEQEDVAEINKVMEEVYSDDEDEADAEM